MSANPRGDGNRAIMSRCDRHSCEGLRPLAPGIIQGMCFDKVDDASVRARHGRWIVTRDLFAQTVACVAPLRSLLTPKQGQGKIERLEDMLRNRQEP